MSVREPKFKAGQIIVRIVDGRAVDAGHEYTVVESDIFSSGGAAQLVADGGFIKELITPENEADYMLKED
jgi:hypothetical protein